MRSTDVFKETTIKEQCMQRLGWPHWRNPGVEENSEISGLYVLHFRLGDCAKCTERQTSLV